MMDFNITLDTSLPLIGQHHSVDQNGIPVLINVTKSHIKNSDPIVQGDGLYPYYQVEFFAYKPFCLIGTLNILRFSSWYQTGTYETFNVSSNSQVRLERWKSH